MLRPSKGCSQSGTARGTLRLVFFEVNDKNVILRPAYRLAIGIDSPHLRLERSSKRPCIGWFLVAKLQNGIRVYSDFATKQLSRATYGFMKGVRPWIGLACRSAPRHFRYT